MVYDCCHHGAKRYCNTSRMRASERQSKPPAQHYCHLPFSNSRYNQRGIAPNGKAPPLPAQLRQALDALPDTLLGKRDHALLVMGFAGAFRRSELVALTMGDVQTTHGSLGLPVKNACSLALFYRIRKPCIKIDKWPLRAKNKENSPRSSR